MVADVRDLTALLPPHDVFREGEAYFDALVLHSSDLVAVIDANGTALRASPTHVLTYHTGSLVGRNMLELVHPEDRSQARATLDRAAAVPDQPFEAGVRLRHADGTWRFFDVTVTNHLGVPGVRGFVVNGRDVTDRQCAQDILRDGEARFRRIVEQAPDVIYR